jgi:DMSO/TMAO reductase YedYZ molybdopterin-dependent catalytic subunit
VVAFAKRTLRATDIRLEVIGAIEQPIVLTAAELSTLPRVTQTTDFHCAAGWSHLANEWSGVRFKDVWEKFILPKARPTDIALVILRCEDGFRTALPLTDLLGDDVLLADRLNGEALTMDHGAPLRLVAPAHYGYKNAKHLTRIELRGDDRSYRALLRVLDHPRARVAYEERGPYLPGWLLRHVFRPFIGRIVRQIRELGSRR